VAVADDIVALHRELNEAELRGDLARIRELLADDFMSIGERGYLLGRQEWLDIHGEFAYQALETREVDVRRYDRAAILRCVQHSRATWRGAEMTLATRLSQTWVELPGGWRLAGVQYSPLDA
jgi:hypothetical protein